MKLIFTLYLLHAYSAFALTGEEVAMKIYESNRESDSIQETKMSLISKNKSVRVRNFISFTKDNNKYNAQTLIVFTSPKKVKNTGILTNNYKEKDSDQWIFLPALKKTRRIASSKKSGRFVGSDLTYQDLENREVNLDNHKLLKSSKLGKKTYLVLQSTPKKESTSIYRMVKVWVDEKTWLVRKAEFYSKRKKPIKTLVVEKIKKYGKSWRAIVTKIKNHKLKHTTILEVEKNSFNNNLESDFFSKAVLENSRKLKKYLK
jgi:hypothetical protein